MIEYRNPNNATSQRLSRDANELYAKFLTMVLWKYRDVLPDDVVITADDIARQGEHFGGTLGVVVVDDSKGRKGRIRLSVVTEAEGKALSRKAGGLAS